MKKKILALILCAMMAATAVVGGTLAYFTDTDTETNTFSLGNVDIDLIEKQEDNKTDFEDDKPLIPGSSTSNAVAKRAWIENTGANDAWVWAELWIPAELVDDNTDGYNASLDNLHVNSYGHFSQTYNASGNYKQTAIDDGIVDTDGIAALIDGMVDVEAEHLWSDMEYYTTKTDDEGNEYAVFITKMAGMLEAEETSLPFMRQVYMDSNVTQCTEKGCECQGKGLILQNGECYNGSWEIIVNAYAVQDADFADVDAAIAAYDGKNPAHAD